MTINYLKNVNSINIFIICIYPIWIIMFNTNFNLNDSILII